jgi:hypothetical protein
MPKKRFYRKSRHRQEKPPPTDRSYPWTWPLRVDGTFISHADPIGSSTPCVPLTSIATVNPMSASDRIIHGENCRDWKKQIAHGDSATTVLTGNKFVVRAPQGVANWQNSLVRCSFGNFTGNITGIPLSFNIPFDFSADSEADNKAKSKLLGKVIEAKTSWRGGNFLAEIRETFHMLRHPLKAFYHETWEFAKTVKRLGRIQQVRQVKSDAEWYRKYAAHLGDAWLAYAFGVKPLIADVNDATDALNRFADRRVFDTQPIKGRGHRTLTVQNGYVSVDPNGWAGSSFSSLKITKNDWNVRYKGTVKCSPFSERFQLQHFGVDFEDFVPAVWEAIPWSFFIDYFTNTGEMLDSLRYVNTGIGWLNRTVRNSGIVQILPPVQTSTFAGYSNYNHCGAAHSLMVRVNRQPWGDLPSPNWHFKFPGLASMKWLNIAALTAQILDSKPSVPKIVRRGF